MVVKSKERIRVRKLRQDGMSIGDIAETVGVAKSSASMWCREIGLSDEQIEVLAGQGAYGAYLGRLRAAENRRRERLMRMEKCMEIGRVKVGNLSDRDLFMAGLAMYWAEGSKKRGRVILINSDSAVIKLWILWLQKFAGLGKEDLIGRVGINEIHQCRIEEVQRYWSLQSAIPLSQFSKASFKRVRNKKVYENQANHYGSLNVIARKSTNLLYEILGMIRTAGEIIEAEHGRILMLTG